MGLIVGGTIGVVASLILGIWPLAVPFGALPLIGAGLVGWVEVGDDAFVDRRLIGDSVPVRFTDVNEVGIGMHQIRKTKLWYPEITTTDGNSVKFQALKSFSGQGTLDRVEEMFLACKARLPENPDDAPIEAVSVGANGELEFAVAPTYESYLREKAKEEAVAAAAPPIPAPVPAAPLTTEPAPRLTVAVESPPDIGEIDEEPDVFDPAPLTPRVEKVYDPPSFEPSAQPAGVVAVPAATATATATAPPQVAVPEPMTPPPIPAMESRQPTAVLTPPPIPQAPPTLIEQPKKDFTKSVEVKDGTNRQFTSLFRRAW